MGAYVKEPKPGIYDWVVSFDLNSLYPHLIMQYNISPETLLDERHPSATVDGFLKQEVTVDGEYAVCANGAQYRKDIHGFLPEMMQKMYDSRVILKKKMIAAKKEYEKIRPLNLPTKYPDVTTSRWLRKISLNSYGAVNEHFRYYSFANAEAITLSGQLSIRWIENRMNEYLNNLANGEEGLCHCI